MYRFKLLIGIISMSVSFLFGADAFQVKPYGFVKLETIYDNTEIFKGDWLLFANPGNPEKADQSIFTMNVRHSRIGLKLIGPEIYGDGVIKGLIETDFCGGFPNSTTAARQPLLRLRHAWVEINKPDWELRLGQDWALIAGPFPNTTSFVVGAGKGHLWNRFSQIKYTCKRKALKVAVSANRPMDGNTKYEDSADGDFDPVGDGERSGMPWVMGRLWYSKGNMTFSASGHYGKEQINDLNATDHSMTTQSMNANMQLKTGPIKWTASVFKGENLNSFFGGIFQGFTTKDSASVTNIASQGGWGQVVYQLNKTLSMTLGGGIDDPDDEDLNTEMRSKNQWIFGNVAYNAHKNLIFMLEANSLKTSYIDSETGENLRIQFVSYLKF